MKRNAIQLTMLVMMMLALAVSSCKDDTTIDGGTGGGGTGGGGTGGGGTGGGGTMDRDYFPRASGNTWNYSNDSSVEMTAGSGDYWSVTNFGPISGISLSIAEELSVETISVKKDGGDYSIKAQLTIVDIPGLADGVVQPIEYVILKDDASTGDTWTGELIYSYSYSVFGVPVNIPPVTIPYNFEIMEKDMTLVVGGTTYTNVIKVNQSFNNLLGGLVSTDLYYADGVGIIRYGTTDGVTTPTDLVSYDLN